MSVTNPTAQEIFDAKLEEIRTQQMEHNTALRLRSDVAINDVLIREAVSDLSVLLTKIYSTLNLDEEKLAGSIKMSRRSEYGRVPELLSKIASTFAWPIASLADTNLIQDNQAEVLDILNQYSNRKIDEDLLLDIKESKGFHSFMNQDDYTIVEASEPEYEEFSYYITTLADYLGLPIIDHKLDPVKWSKNEKKALAKVQAEIAAADEALKAHQALTAA